MSIARYASTTNPATWSTFDQARNVYDAGGYTGLGYVLTQDDPFTFVDLDNCIRNDELDPGAMAIIRQFSSYTERSVSGAGVHIIVEGTANNRKNDRAEVYSDRRFIAITGAIVAEQRTVQPRQAILDAWTAQTFPQAQEQPQDSPKQKGADLLLDDGALLDAIYESKQAGKFAQLMAGNTSGYSNPKTGKADHSAADAALCAILAFWTNHDAQRIDRLFRQSGLMRAKWDRTADGATGRTYGQLTIDNAIRQVVNGYRPFASPGEIEQRCNALAAHFHGKTHSATERVLLAVLAEFEKADSDRTPISSRNTSDHCGLSHQATLKHLRLLCPQTRNARMKRLQADLHQVNCQLRGASNATTAEESLLALRPNERETVLRKACNAGEGAIMAEVIISLNGKRQRVMNELMFYASHPALDIMDVSETHAGSAFAVVYTLRPLQNVATYSLNTVGGGHPDSDHNQCGNILQSNAAAIAEVEFIAQNMTDDAFVVAPPTKTDPRLKLIDDPAKRARVEKLLAPDAKVKPLGVSGPRLFAWMEQNPDSNITAMLATGLSERTIRTILKNAGAALVEAGYSPLVEATKQGKKLLYRLADDWRDRLNALRPDLQTNSVITARAIHHVGERIQRLEEFLAKGMMDRRRKLDETTRAQYEAIKARARLLRARLLGIETPTAEAQPAALALSDELVTVEAAMIQPEPAPVATKQPKIVIHLGHISDQRFGVRELIAA